MSTSNGVIKEVGNKNGISWATIKRRRRRSSDSSLDIPLEDFRGFTKVPRVELVRSDITPYLNKLYNKKTSDVSKHTDSLDTSIHHLRLSQKCTVSLVNQDLEKLKKTFLSQPRRHDSTDSVSDLENDMSTIVKCKICEKAYSSDRKLQKHQENKHMIIYKPNNKTEKRVSFSDKVIIHEVKEYHKCRKCPEIFEEYRVLKLHMKQLHRKRKCYICNYCNKNFVDRSIFKVHIKLHCDVCRALFPNKAKYNKHRQYVCRTLKLHKCETCNDSYFRLMDLKDHSYEHISVCFVCDVCKDQFESKCAIAHHISFLHSNDRPKTLYGMRNLGNERLYLCNFCDESSVERDSIEAHVQLLPDLFNRAMTHHKDYYFCDQCLKNFDTETDMLQHKWSHFLKANDKSQIRDRGLGNNIVKTLYKKDDVIPENMKPRVVLERFKTNEKVLTDAVEFVDVRNVDITEGMVKKAIVDPKSKKTIISRYQCQNCSKYFSTNYCLNRHVETQHTNYENLQCKVCEETFVWPSLLRSHKCIRLNHPEMPFDDARPEIHFDNLNEIGQNGFDDLNIVDNDDYMHTLDFEIPAPIVELTEYENFTPRSQERFAPLSNLGYKIQTVQEVPIEF